MKLIEHDLDEAVSAARSAPDTSAPKVEEDAGAGLLNKTTLIYAVLANRWVLVFCAVVGIAIGFVFGATKPNLYMASGKLMVRSGVVESSTVVEVVTGGLQTRRSTNREAVMLEMALLSNPSIADAVVERVGTERILSIPDPRAKDDANTSALVKAMHELQAFFYGVGRENSRPMPPRVAEEAARRIVGTGIRLDPSWDWGGITVSFLGADPETARAVVEAFLEVAAEHHSKIFSADEKLGAVSKKFEEAQAASKTAREALETFQRENEIYDLDAQVAALVTRVGALREQIVEKRAELSGALESKKYLTKLVEEAAGGDGRQGRMPNPAKAALWQQKFTLKVTIKSMRRAPGETIDDLKKNQAPLEELLKELETRYKQTPDTIPRDNSQMMALKARLQTQTEAVLALESSIPLLEAQLKTQSADLVRLKGLESEMLRLESDAQTKRNRLNLLTTTRDDLEQVSDLEENKISAIRSIEMPILPREKAGPSRGKYLGLGGILGIMLGAGFALLRTLGDPAVRRPSVLARISGREPLGVTQDASAKAQRQGDLIQAAVRGEPPLARLVDDLWWELLSAGEPRGALRIGVLGANPGDGSTTTAACAAIGLAIRTKKPVLLMEVDLMRPGIQRALQLEREEGFLEALSAEIYHADALQNCEFPNMRVITAGARESWPGALATEGAEEMIEEFENGFQFIVYDLGAVKLNPDARRLLWRLDAALVAVEAGTKKADLRSVMETIRAAHVRFAGAVLGRYRSVRPWWSPIRDPELS